MGGGLSWTRKEGKETASGLPGKGANRVEEAGNEFCRLEKTAGGETGYVGEGGSKSG